MWTFARAPLAFPASLHIETTTPQIADGRSVPARVYSVRQDKGEFKMSSATASSRAEKRWKRLPMPKPPAPRLHDAVDRVPALPARRARPRRRIVRVGDVIDRVRIEHDKVGVSSSVLVPDCRNRSAIARPMSCAPPVATATLPSRSTAFAMARQNHCSNWQVPRRQES
jgi:hypothetical protein